MCVVQPVHTLQSITWLQWNTSTTTPLNGTTRLVYTNQRTRGHNALPGHNEISGSPEGDPSETDKEFPVNTEENTPDDHPLGWNDKDTKLSTDKDCDQLEGPTEKKIKK